MPGHTDYWFNLYLNSMKALTSAKTFKQELQAELGNMKVKLEVDASGIPGQLRGGMAPVQRAIQDPLKQAFEAEVKDLGSMARRYGATDWVAPLQQAIDQGLIKPSYTAVANIGNLRDAMISLGKATQTMGLSVDAWRSMSRLDQWVAAVQAAQRRVWGLRGMGYQLESYGRTLTRVTLAIGAAAGVAGNQYLQFADPLNRAARNLELNADLTETLDYRLRELAGTVSMFSPEDQAQGLYLWAAATGAVVSTEEELDATLKTAASVQKLAKLGFVSYGEAVEATTDILSQYGKNVDETESVVATLVKVAAVSKAEVADLAAAFAYAGARADQSNTSFEETAAIFQLLSAYGMRGSAAGRGLARLFENLLAPSQQAKGIMDELFTDVFGRTDVLINAQGQFVGMAEAVKVLSEATENLTEAERAEFVSRITTQNAARVLIPLLELEREARFRNIDAIKATQNIMNGLAGTNEEAFAAMMKDITGYDVAMTSAMDTLDQYWQQYETSVTGRMDKVKASFSAAMDDVGKAVTKTAIGPLMVLAARIDDLATSVEAHPWMIEAALTGAAIIGAVGLLASALGKGLRIVADWKAIAMAVQMDKAANKAMEAAGTQWLAAMEMVNAARIQAGAAAGQAVGGGVVRTAGGVLVPATAAVAGAGGVAASAGGLGAALMGLLPIGAVIAAALAYLGISDQLKKAGQDEAASMVVLADSYEEYKELLKDADKEQYAFVQSLYETVKAQATLRTENLQDPYRYARNMQAALKSVEDRLTKLNISQREFLHPAVATYWQTMIANWLPTMDQYQLAVLANKDAMLAWADSYGLTAEAGQAFAKWVSEFAQAEVDRKAQIDSQVNAELELWRVRLAAHEAYLAARAKERTVDDRYRQVSAATWAEIKKQTIGEQYRMAAQESWKMVEAEEAKVIALARLADQLGLTTRELGDFAEVMGQVVMLSSEWDLDPIDQALKMAAGGARSMEDWAEEALRGAERAWSQLEGLVDILPQDKIMEMWEDYLDNAAVFYHEAAEMADREADLYVASKVSAFDQEVKAKREAVDEMERLAKQSVEEQERLYEQAQQGFRSMVEKMLQPTKVTQEDVWETAAGTYQDKWDEAARQMRAAVEDPTSDWRKALIPEGILRQGEDAIRVYGSRWIDAFYAGMHPEAINWPAFIRDFKNMLQREAGAKWMVEEAMRQLAAAGIDATDEQVMAALGLVSPFEQMFFGGKTPGQATTDLSTTLGSSLSNITVMPEDLSGPAGLTASYFMGGVVAQIKTVPFSAIIAGIWKAEVEANYTPIREVGRIVGKWFWDGFTDRIQGSGLIDDIVAEVLGELGKALGKPQER